MTKQKRYFCIDECGFFLLSEDMNHDEEGCLNDEVCLPESYREVDDAYYEHFMLAQASGDYRIEYQEADIPVIRELNDEEKHQVDFTNQELEWQANELIKVNKAINSYQQDQPIPEIYSELRVTSYTEDDYYSLLGDRKLLVEYLEQEDFLECERPTLSGLAV